MSFEHDGEKVRTTVVKPGTLCILRAIQTDPQEENSLASKLGYAGRESPCLKSFIQYCLLFLN